MKCNERRYIYVFTRYSLARVDVQEYQNTVHRSIKSLTACKFQFALLCLFHLQSNQAEDKAIRLGKSTMHFVTNLPQLRQVRNLTVPQEIMIESFHGMLLVASSCLQVPPGASR